MEDPVRAELTRRGYTVNDEAYGIIALCDDWYRARITPSHARQTVAGVRYTVERMGFAQRLAADDANACEVVDIDPGEAAYDAVNAVLRANRFDRQYRRQLELCAAEGTAACFVRLDGADVYPDGTLLGGEIRLTYVDASGYMPLSVDNGDVTEAAFWGTDMRRTGDVTRLVICTRGEDGVYGYETMTFGRRGEMLGRPEYARLGKVRPFAVMRNADVNTFEHMQGFGLPKLYGVIPLLAALDSAFTGLMGDIDSAEKITLVNELLCRFDDEGTPVTPNEQLKRRFVLLGEKLPEQQELVHEITPEIRIGAFRETIELILGLLSRRFGYGMKRYTLSDRGDDITATQYAGERHDMLQELNRQRFEAREYIRSIVAAVIWFMNEYRGARLPQDAEINVEFDDSCLTDRAELTEAMRRDVLDGIGGDETRKMYLMRRYNISEDEARGWIAREKHEDDKEKKDIGR